MPRALTEQEKCKQCEKLLEKGKAVVLSQGIKKVSVDDITRAAGMAKGSFYQHFDSKERYLYALIESIHRQAFARAERMIRGQNDLRANARDFFNALFHMPEFAFFILNDRDIYELFDMMPDSELRTFKHMERELFEGLLRLAGIDTERVKAGVVHNYVHALFLMMGSDLMTEGDLRETVDLITDSLIDYIFGGAR